MIFKKSIGRNEMYPLGLILKENALMSDSLPICNMLHIPICTDDFTDKNKEQEKLRFVPQFDCKSPQRLSRKTISTRVQPT